MPDILGRYYTEQNISNLLVSCFRTNAPKTVLELGVGSGSLIKAARDRWNHVRLITADIDSKNFRRLRKNIPDISVSKVNGLDREINEKLNITVGGVDVAVCNPPYKFIPQKYKRHVEILERAQFVNSLHLGRLTTDVVFLAQNLNLLSDDGELGIILPDTLLSGDSFRLFRLDLLKNASIMSVIQLPPGVFRKTEAQTHILLLKKRNCSGR